MSDGTRLTDEEIYQHHARQNALVTRKVNCIHLKHDDYMRREGLVYEPNRLPWRQRKRKSLSGQCHFNFDGEE
jgi:hypothetical protein